MLLVLVAITLNLQLQMSHLTSLCALVVLVAASALAQDVLRFAGDGYASFPLVCSRSVWFQAPCSLVLVGYTFCLIMLTLPDQ